MNIAVVSASSVVPPTGLRNGIERLRAMSLNVAAQANCEREYFLYSGTDRERSEALYAAAIAREVDVLWFANGGSGAGRILPLLDAMPVPPRKTMLGFSDTTSVLSFARTRWNWRTIHSPMVASFAECDERDANAAVRLAAGQRPEAPWGTWPLHWIGPPPNRAIEGELIGGNLSVWTTLVGTAFAEPAAGKILFLEDVGEVPYRIDRLVTQLRQAGQLDGIAAIVLGAFTDCEDDVRQVPSANDPTVRVPLRKTWPIDEALVEIFAGLGVPVAMGLPVGHGKNTTPLPLGVPARLQVDGSLQL